MGLAVVSAIASIAVNTYYDRIYSNITSYAPLLDNVSLILDEIVRTNITVFYERIYSILPLLAQVEPAYERLYYFMEKYKPLIVLLYNETHSKEYHDIVKSMGEVSREVSKLPFTGKALGRALLKVRELLNYTRYVSGMMIEAYNIAETFPPRDVALIVNETLKISRLLPPDQFNYSLNKAYEGVVEAKAMMEGLPKPGKLSRVLFILTLVFALLSILLLSMWRRRS